MSSEWSKARKKPVEIEFREVEPREEFFDSRTRQIVRGETIRTREGTLKARCGLDLILRGVERELYPIDRQIFDETCPNCTGDNIEFVEETKIPGSHGCPTLRQRWRCLDCERTFTLAQKVAWVAELEES